ncbi:RNA-binding protein [Lotmaria passim]
MSQAAVNDTKTSTNSADLPSNNEQRLKKETSATTTTTTTTAAMAAPISHTPSLAASADKSPSTPPPPSSKADSGTAAADGAKVKNQNVRRNVYISGVPPVYRSEEFRQLCMQFGRVEAAKLCVDNRNAPTKAYGFALYYSEESAAACIRGLNGSFLQGRCVQARLADSHATPQPLGDEGSAANTTIPPPSHQRRYEQRGSGGNRKGRNSGNNMTPNSGMARSSTLSDRRGVSPASAGAMSSPGLTNALPASPYTAIPAGATLLAAPGEVATPTGIPLDMNAYYQFMTVIPAATTAAGAATTTTPLPQVMTPSAVTTPPTHNTRSRSPANGSPATDGGFGAIGTPVTGPLAAAALSGCGGHANGGSGLSPASMALSPPLLSSHSTESGGSVSPNASRAMTASVTALTSLTQQQQQQQQPQPQVYSTAPTPFQIAYAAQPMMPQPMIPNIPAGQMAIMTGTNADGTPTFLYYPLPANNGGVNAFAPAQMAATSNGVPQAPLPGMSMSAMPVSKPTAGQLPGSVMYFSVPQPQQPQQPQPTLMQMAHSFVPTAAMAPGGGGMPANCVMLDNNNSSNLGMPFQVLRQM